MPRPALFARQALLGPEFPLPLDRPFTHRQATAAGVSRGVLARLCRQGLVRRLLRSVYVAAQVEDTLWLRTKALLLVVPEHAVVTDWTAVWLYTGLLRPNDHLEVPPVTVFVGPGMGRLRNALSDSGERTLAARDVTEIDGLRVTTPLRTALDLGRLVHQDLAIGALDALLRQGSFTLPELLGNVERFRGQRGVVQLRALAPLADGRAESPGESVLRLRWIGLTSLPPPTPQVPVLDVRGRAVYWLDLGVEELRLGVEYDGEAFHTSPADRAHDLRRREWIRREAGWLVVPVTKQNVFGATRDIEDILVAAVEEARRRLGAERP